MVAAGCKNYEDTLIAVHKSHIAQKLPINYFLIDSWWCKCSRSLSVFVRSLKEAAAPDDMLHRGTGRLVEESLDAPCKNDWLSRCARWSRQSDKQ